MLRPSRSQLSLTSNCRSAGAPPSGFACGGGIDPDAAQSALQHPGTAFGGRNPRHTLDGMEETRLRYRLLTGTDDRAFCERVSRALDEGYHLHGSPSVTFDGSQVVTAQAVVLAAEPGGEIGS